MSGLKGTIEMIESMLNSLNALISWECLEKRSTQTAIVANCKKDYM